MKKTISLLLICMLTVMVLTGCTATIQTVETNAPAGTTAGATTAAATTGGNRPFLRITVQSHPAAPIRNDWVVWRAHEKNANVDLEVSGYQGNWWETIPLIIASGDMPDLMWMVRDDANKFGDQGALVNLLDVLDKIPNLKAFMDKQQDQVSALISAQGNIYLHPAYGVFDEYDGLFLYRKDIFEKNNLSTPKDYDEFYNVLKKLKELYPESTPLYFPGLDTISQFGPSFNIALGLFLDTDSNTVKYGPIEDNFKILLEFLAKAYEEKLIPMEFGSLTTDKRDALITTNKTFIYYGYLTHIDRYNSIVRESNPEFTLAFMPPPAGPTGKAYNAEKFFVGEGLTVTSTSQNKDAALKFLDYLFTEEGATACCWGLEGETYTVVNGNKQFLPVVKDLSTANREFGLFTSGNTGYGDHKAIEALMSEETARSYQEGLKYMKPVASLLPALLPDEIDATTVKSQAIGKYMEENVTKFIFGQRSLSEWDNYVKDIKNLGLDDVLKVYNDALARANAASK